MLIDAATLPERTVLEADVCIIGSGAAGMTIARDLASTNLRVILLESGPHDYDEAANDLNAGQSVGRTYMPLNVCRQRFLGGTTNHWGGWCLPHEPIDFDRGWPFGRAELDPFYRRAHEILQLGPFDYRLSSWGVGKDDIPAPFQGPHFVAKMLQNSPPTRFREQYGPELQRASRVMVCLNATATRLVTAPGDGRVEALQVATPGGKTIEVKAGGYVLATGGIENARLLLLSGEDGRGGLGNPNGLVGRNFMVHLNSPAGVIAVADPYTDFSFYTNATSNGRDYAPFGHRFVSFIGLSEQTMRAQNLPNVRMMWSFEYREDIKTITTLKSALRWHGSGHRLADIGAVMSDLGAAGTYVFRRLFAASDTPVTALGVYMMLEPTPNPESRVSLCDERDALGQRRVKVDWRLDPADKDGARRILRLLGAEVGRTGLGRLRTLLEADEWPDSMYGDQHHMGTTKMHRDPAHGVVDPDCRMHGVENLWVAGSSVFPRAGMSNPTLTITALALRLAQQLRHQLA